MRAESRGRPQPSRNRRVAPGSRPARTARNGIFLPQVRRPVRSFDAVVATLRGYRFEVKKVLQIKLKVK
jgi:hypothetical protein